MNRLLLSVTGDIRVVTVAANAVAVGQVEFTLSIVATALRYGDGGLVLGKLDSPGSAASHSTGARLGRSGETSLASIKRV